MDQDALRKKISVNRDQQSPLRLIPQCSSIDVADGSASNIKSKRDNSNLKSRGSLNPFTTEGNSHEILDIAGPCPASKLNKQIYRDNEDPLNFTICRN